MCCINYGFLVFVVCLASAIAGDYPHVAMGHGMHGNNHYGNQGFHGSTLQNFYPGDWNNQRMGSYQYFDYESSPWNSNWQGGNMFGNTGGSLDWGQSGGSWNQPHLNTWHGDQRWNNGGMNNMNGWNNNWNNGWNSNDFGNNMNNGWNNDWTGSGGIGWNNGVGNNWNTGLNNGFGNNGWSGNGGLNGWGNNLNTGWNNGLSNNGWSGNGGLNGWGNNWNNNWGNNFNNGWTVPEGLALQSH